MKASEVIKRYEAYCPQEFSMEGDNGLGKLLI